MLFKCQKIMYTYIHRQDTTNCFYVLRQNTIIMESSSLKQDKQLAEHKPNKLSHGSNCRKDWPTKCIGELMFWLYSPNITVLKLICPFDLIFILQQLLYIYIFCLKVSNECTLL